MSGWLRSWKLCEISPHLLDGVAGWTKRRLRRADFLIPPGNVFLEAIHSGCRMAGAGWAQHEVGFFNKAHDEVAEARCLDSRTIWLPHLPGIELRQALETTASSAAFAELGRFHRLGAIHGDPHGGNFLYAAEDDRCRIIDFETTPPRGMNPAQSRARDFAILALDLWKHGHGSADDFRSWLQAYGGDDELCPVERLFRHPGFRLRQYWKWLGYLPPGKDGR
jgi:tRNA A-37 threonylcarbamoyl transferase component Bud32